MQHSEIIGYYIGYKLTDQIATYQYKTVLAKKNKRGTIEEEEMSLVLKNLEKFSRYSVSIQAYNKIGTGPKNVPEVVTKTLEDGNFNIKYIILKRFAGFDFSFKIKFLSFQYLPKIPLV